MVEVTDADISEALRLAKSPTIVATVRKHSTYYRHFLAHARTIAKLRIATEGLDLIAHGSSQEAAQFADKILLQIKEVGNG